MILSTPHPPQIPTPALPLPLAGPGLFSVNPGIHAEDALIAAADYLECASAAADEVADHPSIECRALARSVVHQLDMARVLIEATLAALQQTQVATRQD